MKPTGVGPATTIRYADAIDLPIHLRYSSPLSPQRRPRAVRFDSGNAAWPMGELPLQGNFYLVPTTWRALVDAAISTGRDQRDWLSAYPRLARLEILARVTPLRAYLGRRDVGGNTHVVPNDVYLNGTERTAQAAMGYRLGMTMAEFVARSLLGLGPTLHAESARPTGAGKAWSNEKKQPDLVAYRGGLPWLIEAKGGKRIGLPTLRGGAEQLVAPNLMAGPHVRVLCGASLSHRLLLTVDIELPSSWERIRKDSGRSPAGPSFMAGIDSRPLRDAAADLARSRMLVYHAISSASPEQRWVRRFRNQTGAMRDPDSWATAPIEDQPTIGQLRGDLAARSAADVIGVRIPGTGLDIGLSAQLYAACRVNAEFDRAAADRANGRTPRVLIDERGRPRDQQDAPITDPSAVDYRISERAREYEDAYDELREEADNQILSAFAQFESATAEDAIPNERPAVRTQRPIGAFEGVSRGAYISIGANAIPDFIL